MDNKKTISYLNSKTWYRFLKVIFLFLLLVIIIIVNCVAIDNILSSPSLESIFLFFIGGNIATLLFFEILRRVFYYIVLGAIRPKKQ